MSGTMQSLQFVMENRLSYLLGLLFRELRPSHFQNLCPRIFAQILLFGKTRGH